MKTLFNRTGLPFFGEDEILKRHAISKLLTKGVDNALIKQNNAWRLHQCETPILTPSDFISDAYDFHKDIYNTGKLVCRPETTMGSYLYGEYLVSHHLGVKPPFVVWQVGKSFRKEIEQPSKHCRYKEFYQQEFQCFYTKDTMNDYQQNMLEPMRKLVEIITNLPTRVIESDRTPSYSKRTMDIEVDNGDKFMEVCSISLRTDCPFKCFNKDMLVLELAFGLDRLVYNKIISENKET